MDKVGDASIVEEEKRKVMKTAREGRKCENKKITTISFNWINSLIKVDLSINNIALEVYFLS